MKIFTSRAIAAYSAMSKEYVVLYLNLFELFKILMGTNEYTVKYGKMSIKYIMIDIYYNLQLHRRNQRKRNQKKRNRRKRNLKKRKLR